MTSTTSSRSGTVSRVVAIGDVRGKGVEAAIVTALARHTLRAVAVRVSSPAEALKALNDVLLLEDTDRFCTVAMLRLTHADDRWTVVASSGDHPLPLLIRAGAVLQPVGRPGMLLGVLPNPALDDAHLALEPGETVLLYTDGVPEGRRDGELFGYDRLTAAVSTYGPDPSALVTGIRVEVLTFQGGTGRDDMAIVAVRVAGQPD